MLRWIMGGTYTVAVVALGYLKVIGVLALDWGMLTLLVSSPLLLWGGFWAGMILVVLGANTAMKVRSWGR